ncbi:[FeFe] hydrogenase, group A [Ferrimonas pelagia]|uniref:Iron hydrogenase large subunit HydA n=1 Tax=Ferrimonas pelagia TaxID=1177826 RepID=A0ABP9EQZ9_9GAMM
MTTMNHSSGEIRGLFKINADKCKGCDACKAFCPPKGIEGASGAPHRINEDKCLSCGQCMLNCPFDAIEETHSAINQVIEKLADPKTTVVGIIAPAVRVAIGEEFGMKPGSLVTGEMYGAMHKGGFRVFDCNFSADLTIMEEGSELIHRVHASAKGEAFEGKLPQFTSCCPAWVRMVENQYPALIPHLSTAKSPQQMSGTVAKTYGTEIYDTDANDIFTVSVMPCTAKKMEASREEFNDAWEWNIENGKSSGASYQDVDVVLTTKELAQLFKLLQIDLSQVAPAKGDSLFADYSGAATIFGNTGGVMEAALRTAHKVLTDEELATLEYTPVRGLEGVKEASVTLFDKHLNQEITLNVAVVHDMAKNIAPIVNEVLAGTSKYHFIEVMNCPGGCVNGAGQPVRGEGTSWMNRA